MEGEAGGRREVGGVLCRGGGAGRQGEVVGEDSVVGQGVGVAFQGEAEARREGVVEGTDCCRLAGNSGLEYASILRPMELAVRAVNSEEIVESHDVSAKAFRCCEMGDSVVVFHIAPIRGINYPLNVLAYQRVIISRFNHAAGEYSIILPPPRESHTLVA